MSRSMFALLVLALSATVSATQLPGEQIAPPAPPAVTLPTPAVPAPFPGDQQPPAQPARAVQPQPTPPPGRAPVAVPIAPVPQPPEPPRKTRGRDLNVQIELTISDQIGTAAPDKKVISMMTADATMGRVRATAQSSKGPTSLNVDARPVALDNDRILLELTVEFAPLRESGITQSPTVLNESISVILQNGKPMVVSQAADPISDRKMTVEVKATIVK